MIEFILEGTFSAMDGESLILSSDNGTCLKIPIKDEELRWKLYCQKVVVTIKGKGDLAIEESL